MCSVIAIMVILSQQPDVEIPKEVAQIFIDECRKQHKELAAGQIRALASKRMLPTEKAKAIKLINNSILPIELQDGLKINDIGKLWDTGVKVIQVVDENNFIGEIQFVPYSLGSHKLDRYGNISSSTPPNEHTEIVWFNTPTKEMVDSKIIVINDVIWVYGTKQYQTVSGGTKTLLCIKTVNILDVLKLTYKFRIWADITGKFNITAKFCQLVDGNVQLELENGKIISVPLTKLSSNDQRFVKSLIP